MKKITCVLLFLFSVFTLNQTWAVEPRIWNNEEAAKVCLRFYSIGTNPVDPDSVVLGEGMCVVKFPYAMPFDVEFRVDADTTAFVEREDTCVKEYTPFVVPQSRILLGRNGEASTEVEVFEGDRFNILQCDNTTRARLALRVDKTIIVNCQDGTQLAQRQEESASPAKITKNIIITINGLADATGIPATIDEYQDKSEEKPAPTKNWSTGKTIAVVVVVILVAALVFSGGGGDGGGPKPDPPNGH